MARQRKTPFQPWQTKKDNGIEERYIRLGNSLMIAPAMLALSDKAFRIYTNMLLEAGGKKQFTYPRSKYMRISSISAFKNDCPAIGQCRSGKNSLKILFGCLSTVHVKAQTCTVAVHVRPVF